MKTIELNIAIIPNHSIIAVPTSYTTTYADMLRKNIAGHNSRFGLNIQDDDEVIGIWYGSENESYQNGGLPEEYNTLFPAEGVEEEEGYEFDKYNNRIDVLPEYLPAKMFKEAKEGDKVLLFKSEHCEVYGVCNQLSNRYSRCGNFETVFSKVTR